MAVGATGRENRVSGQQSQDAARRSHSGDVLPFSYHVERLDDVRERLANLEGRMESMATEAMLERLKTAMLITWISVSIGVFAAVATVIGTLVRLWIR